MDLYGSTTYKDEKGDFSRKPAAYQNMLIEDPIPEKGFIDPDSVQIWAAVPTIGVQDRGFKANGWYDVPAGVNYAVRRGTLRWLLNEYSGNQEVSVHRVLQNENETLEEFKTRILANQLQWGIYHNPETKEEVFLCNFGNVGKFDDPIQNNGILYSDYYEKDGRNYGVLYPEIFGESGASAGNIVSYYIEFNTFYPDIAGQKNVYNAAYFSSKTTSRVERGANYIINNGNGIGIVRKSEVKLKLVDKADMQTPIANAEFIVQKSEDGQWRDTAVSGKTDSNGNMTFGPFPKGKYRLVQTSTAEKYRFNNDTYGSSDSFGSLVNAVSSNGEFEIKNTDRYGFGTIVTNEKIKQYKIDFKFVSADTDKQLPEEINNQIPDQIIVNEGETAEVPQNLVLNDVRTETGIWHFEGWDKEKIVDVMEDGCFTGTWRFSEFSGVINAAPSIDASDKTITVGDPFDALKDAAASDLEDGDLTDRLQVISNTVDNSRAGEYEVVYKVTDSLGASTIKKIKVTVKDREVIPEPEDNGSADPSSPSFTDKTPDTGDNSHMMVWIVLCLVSIVAMICLVLKQKK